MCWRLQISKNITIAWFVQKLEQFYGQKVCSYIDNFLKSSYSNLQRLKVKSINYKIFPREHVTPGMWHLACDTWHVTPDMWHLTPDNFFLLLLFFFWWYYPYKSRDSVYHVCITYILLLVYCIWLFCRYSFNIGPQLKLVKLVADRPNANATPDTDTHLLNDICDTIVNQGKLIVQTKNDYKLIIYWFNDNGVSKAAACKTSQSAFKFLTIIVDFISIYSGK